MAQKLGRQSEWPRVKREPEVVTLAPDGWQRSERSPVGPLRYGTSPGVGPKGEAVVADYTRESDFGTDMVARDRKAERKFPSDLISRELRGPGGRAFEPNLSKGKDKPD